MLDKGDVDREEYETKLVDLYLQRALQDEAKLGRLHTVATKVRHLSPSSHISSCL